MHCQFNRPTVIKPASFERPNLTIPAFDASNYRMAAGQGYVYDAAGSTIADANGQTYIYDAENKMVTASNASGTLGQIR